MSDNLIAAAAASAATPIHLLDHDGLERLKATLGERQGAWIAAAGFAAKAASVLLVPGDDGKVALVLCGIDAGPGDADPTAAGKLAEVLPPGDYRFAEAGPWTELAAIYFGLGSYRFTRYRKSDRERPRLVLPDGDIGAEVRRIVDGICLARDLINTPANDLGPAELAAAVRDLGARHDAKVSEISGAALARDFPMVHAVGAAATEARAPRLVDLTWGDPSHPKVTLVGKGVCFDTGGLDLKPSSGMLLMKKDMGGAANTMALAHIIMDAGLPVRLRLLVPTVENAVSSAAFRPGDILASRKGISVEIGNTDAEGRLILGDALAYAFEEDPLLVVDMATLTGAARVALGPDVPAIFTGSDALAENLSAHAQRVRDPLWRLPLFAPYAKLLDSKVADINNVSSGGLGGAITAALFLARFADPERWIHVDLFAWNGSTKPGRPVGGECQSIRALYELVKQTVAARN